MDARCMNIFVSHPTGNRNVRAIIESLYAGNELAAFGTTIAFKEHSLLLKLLPSKISAELKRRSFSIPRSLIWTHPNRELRRMFSSKLGLHKDSARANIDSVYTEFDLAVSQWIDKIAGRKKIDAVYAYEDGALATFTIAKSRGLKCIYDLPIAYWETGRKLMLSEADRLPNWASTLGGGIKDTPGKLNKKTKELELADMVITPSTFVSNSLPVWAGTKKIVVAPFGSPKVEPEENKSLESGKQNHRPLRVLFAGSMGQRKGLADLFAAIKLLNGSAVELVVMGSLMAPMKFYKDELSHFTYEPGRPNREVLELMRTCDVFCLPSIVEGRALVIQEAMSQGLPVIITPNTGGEDLVKEGQTGFLVPISSPESIAAKISWFLDNRSTIEEMGKMAQAHAAQYSWNNYAGAVTGAIHKFLA